MSRRASPRCCSRSRPIMWGYVSVQTIFDKVHLKKDVPADHPDGSRAVTKDNLGTWARQLKTWGFTDVPDAVPEHADSR